ncbi:MAG: hypothetical protein Q4C45_09635 [Oscillospiraceae bacterium]|nr:hypothetical protein [Oscillospiraceae bacterium]
MLWLWILGILAVLILLLCRTRVGVRAEFGVGALTLDVKMGLFHIRILPVKEKKGKTAKAAKKAAKTAEETAKKPKTPLPKPSLADIRDAVRTLAPPLKRALGRTRRGIRIHPMQLSVTVGGREDPAAAAELYGYLHAGVWTGMPVLEQMLVVPAPYIHIGIDFDTPDTIAEGELGVSARIGTLLAAALGVGIPALRWFLRYQKKHKQQTPTQAPEHAAA